MNEFVFLMGVLLVILTFVDAFVTILWVDGSAGPITSRVSRTTWKVFQALFPKRHRALSLAGPTILTVTLMLWIVLLCAGWVVAFSADPGALKDARGPGMADLPERVWFAASTMFTVGNGDAYPRGGFWEIMSSLLAMSGIVMVTIAVSYVLSVIPVVSQQRALAAQVSNLGVSAEDFVIAAWDGTAFRRLDAQLDNLVQQLGVLSDQHLGYPILHHFHAADPDKATAPALAILDDALTLLSCGVGAEARPAPATLKTARAATRNFLQVLSAGRIGPAREPPPPPDLQRLRDAGIPVVGEEAFAQALQSLHDQRRLLLGLVRDSGYDWPRDRHQTSR